MSITFCNIECTNCDIRASDLGIGVVRYVLPNGDRVQTFPWMGWCSDCRGIEVIEAPPIEVREEAVRTIEGLKGRLKSLTLKGGFFGLGSRRPLPGVDWWDVRVLQAEIERLEGAVQVSTHRPIGSHARCLTCGSPKTVGFVRPREVSATPHSLDIEHEGCGGTFVVRDSGAFQVRVAIIETLLSPDGVVLEKHEIKERSAGRKRLKWPFPL